MIWHMNDSKWDKIAGGAKEIAVDSKGVLWIVTEENLIFRRTSSKESYTTQWEKVSGKA